MIIYIIICLQSISWPLCFSELTSRKPVVINGGSGEDPDLKCCHRWQRRGDPWHEIFSPQNPKSQICNWCTGDTAGADWCGVPGTVGDEVKL